MEITMLQKLINGSFPDKVIKMWQLELIHEHIHSRLSSFAYVIIEHVDCDDNEVNLPIGEVKIRVKNSFKIYPNFHKTSTYRIQNNHGIRRCFFDGLEELGTQDNAWTIMKFTSLTVQGPTSSSSHNYLCTGGIMSIYAKPPSTLN